MMASINKWVEHKDAARQADVTAHDVSAELDTTKHGFLHACRYCGADSDATELTRTASAGAFSLGTLDPEQVLEALYTRVSAYNYAEEDDWDLVGKDLECGLEVIKRSPLEALMRAKLRRSLGKSTATPPVKDVALLVDVIRKGVSESQRMHRARVFDTLSDDVKLG